MLNQLTATRWLSLLSDTTIVGQQRRLTSQDYTQVKPDGVDKDTVQTEKN